MLIELGWFPGPQMVYCWRHHLGRHWRIHRGHGRSRRHPGRPSTAPSRICADFSPKGQRTGPPARRSWPTLRKQWLAQAESFLANAVAALREISSQLRQRTSRDEHLARAKAVLKDVFGYRSFRPGQEDIIATVLSGRDCVGVMPTGAGKSSPFRSRRACWAAPRWSSRRSSP
jgi:hypothetical protein